jgi:4-hydroxythreonine-4-phosphate dehydrogenase
MAQSPRIAITLGDPVGIGPEVVAKALATSAIASLCSPVVIGNAAILDRAFTLVGADLRARGISDPTETVPPGTVGVVEPVPNESLTGLELGALSAHAGKASVEWAMEAARLAMEFKVDAIATAPINKAAANLAGFEDIGHMEIFQRQSKSPEVATMLMTPGLRVVHLTTHRSLRLACDAVTRNNILAKLRLTHHFFAQHGVPCPRIGVSALNPHGGEEGILGNEEIEAIAPAVQEANAEGINALGPIPADTIFHQAIGGHFDVVLAMYHDQGHIPIKVHGWEESISINLGLPFIRTSVDHGTAFDIAGQGIADATSMAAAIRVATHLALAHRLTDL